MGYVEEAFKNNWIAPGGENVAQFEHSIEDYLGGRSVCAVNSGTAALHLSLILCGIKPGDEVICQSFTFAASANVIRYLGAIPIFVDSELETWNLCPLTLEMAIKDRIKAGKMPKAIIAVNSCGMPFKVNEIVAVAQKYQILLIEDAADSLGSTYQNKYCGTFGDFSILSFNGNKIITTSGGGALICKTPEQKSKGIYLSTQARDDAPFYEHSEIGYNYRMSNISAGIGRGQMEVLEQRITQRRANHDFYADLFKKNEGVTILSEPNTDFYSNFWLSTILINETIAGFSREDLRIKFMQNGIESRPLWKPMHLQPVFKNFPYYGNRVAENFFRDGLCLPSGSNLTEEEHKRISQIVDFFIN